MNYGVGHLVFIKDLPLNEAQKDGYESTILAFEAAMCLVSGIYSHYWVYVLDGGFHVMRFQFQSKKVSYVDRHKEPFMTNDAVVEAAIRARKAQLTADFSRSILE